MKPIFEVFRVSLRLGLTSFGGPVAHLGYFREEYVKRRGWLDEQSYADVVALCQFLPGPASSQVGMAIGIERAGILGGVTAWLGFTLPSAIALVLFAYFLHAFNIHHAGWLHGLMIAAVAVVGQAVWGMAQRFAATRLRGSIAGVAAVITLLVPSAISQVGVILLAGLIGWRFIPRPSVAEFQPLRVPVSRRVGLFALGTFFGLLLLLPALRFTVHGHWLALIDDFYRSGALVFGGGHVVLPLLQRDVVPTGWVTNAQFLAGYGGAQAVPGPLFTFAAYLGYVSKLAPNGLFGAALALLAIFLPAFLLVLGTMPFWNVLRKFPAFQSALAAINAAVVGILVAALYNPVWTSAVHTPFDVALVIVSFLLLELWRLPAWLVVWVSAAGGLLIAWIQ